jgi:hypothetical protein
MSADLNIARVAGGDPAAPSNPDGSKRDAAASSFGQDSVDTGATNTGDIYPAASADDPPGLKMSRAAAQAAGLNKDQRQQFHRAISGEGITSFDELLSIARQIKAGSY